MAFRRASAYSPDVPFPASSAPSEPVLPKRLQPGRAFDAVDWVGGTGRQAPAGNLVLDLVLSIHHDQARAFARALQALSVSLGDSPAEPAAGVRVVVLPVDRVAGDAAHARLVALASGGDPAARRVARIGLGAEPGHEAAGLPLLFTRMSSTARDGRPYAPIAPELFAVADGATFVGRVDAGDPELDLTRLESEPCWVAGVGYLRESLRVPSIVRVLAVGRAPEEAASRGAAIAQVLGVAGDDRLALKLTRVLPVDARVLREALEHGLAAADGMVRRLLEVALGRVDHLVKGETRAAFPAEVRALL